MPRLRHHENLTYNLKKTIASRKGNVYDKHAYLYAWYQPGFQNHSTSGDNSVWDYSGNARNLSAPDAANRPAAPTSDSPIAGRGPVGGAKNFLETGANHDVTTITKIIRGYVGAPFRNPGIGPGFPRASAAYANDQSQASVTTSFNFGNGFDDSPFSIAAWIKVTADNNTQIIASKHNTSGKNRQQWLFSLSNRDTLPTDSGSRQLRLFLTDAYAEKSTTAWASGYTLDINRWYHVAATYDGRGSATANQGIKLYVDGVEVGLYGRGHDTGYEQMDGPYSNVKFTLGNYESDSTGGFDGNIAELAVWSTVLSSENILALYEAHNGIAAKTSGFINLPPRIEIRNRDNATGSYPTILRMGDKDRRGAYNISFNDNNTIFFGKKIEDKFSITERNASGPRGVFGFSKDIDEKKWVFTKGLQIRKELFVKPGGSTADDGALVFIGSGSSDGRWIRTKEKVRNPTVKMSLIFGPSGRRRGILRGGLGLRRGDITEDIKVQASKTASPGSWKTIRTFTNDVDDLFQSSSALSRKEFNKLLNKRKRVKAKIHPNEFSFGSDPFYIRVIQETFKDDMRAVWALGEIEIDYQDENVAYPLMIHQHTHVGRKVFSGAIATPHIPPDMEAFGRSISGISDVHIKFTPGENITPFDDSRIPGSEEGIFDSQGTPPEILPGFSSPTWSKTQHTVDLSVVQEKILGTPKGAATNFKTDLMAYYNSSNKSWQSQRLQGVAKYWGSLFTSVDEVKSVLTASCIGFSPQYPFSISGSVSDPDQILRSNSHTTTFGFPTSGRYESNSNAPGQTIKASDLGITKPFLLEKCKLRFNGKFNIPVELSTNEGAHAYALQHVSPKKDDGSSATAVGRDAISVITPTFFILREYKTFLTASNPVTVFSGSSSGGRANLIENINEVVPFATSPIEGSPYTRSISKTRDLITFGQLSIVYSGSDKFGYRGQSWSANNNFDQVDGYVRDTRIDISGSTTFRGITGSFDIDFPCRKQDNYELGPSLRYHDDGTYGNAMHIQMKNTGTRGLDKFNSLARGISNISSATKVIGKKDFLGVNTGCIPETFVSGNIYEIKDDTSPYLILPNDDLIFGWQFPIPVDTAHIDPNFPYQLALSGSSSLILYGSQLKDGKEFHETINQNLASDSLHEIIGSEPVVDDFDLSTSGEFIGGYLDTFVQTSDEDPLKRISTDTKSRILTPKGPQTQGEGLIWGTSAAIISPDGFWVSGKPSGFNDGVLIKITDGEYRSGYFFGFRQGPVGPLTGKAPTASEQGYDNFVTWQGYTAGASGERSWAAGLGLMYARDIVDAAVNAYLAATPTSIDTFEPLLHGSKYGNATGSWHYLYPNTGTGTPADEPEEPVVFNSQHYNTHSGYDPSAWRNNDAHPVCSFNDNQRITWNAAFTEGIVTAATKDFVELPISYNIDGWDIQPLAGHYPPDDWGTAPNKGIGGLAFGVAGGAETSFAFTNAAGIGGFDYAIPTSVAHSRAKGQSGAVAPSTRLTYTAGDVMSIWDSLYLINKLDYAGAAANETPLRTGLSNGLKMDYPIIHSHTGSGDAMTQARHTDMGRPMIPYKVGFNINNDTYAFKITGGDNDGGTFTMNDFKTTLRALSRSIDHSSLEVDVKLEDTTFSRGLRITSRRGGDTGNNTIRVWEPRELNCGAPLLQDDYRFRLQGMTGGDSTLDATFGSFSKNRPHIDAMRTIRDSILSPFDQRAVELGDPINYYGTTQSGQKAHRPTYAFDLKRFGHFSNMIKQARDTRCIARGITTGVSFTQNTVAVESPVQIRFVSGSTDSSTGIRSFTRSSPSSSVKSGSVNQTINSALSSSYIDDPTAGMEGVGDVFSGGIDVTGEAGADGGPAASS